MSTSERDAELAEIRQRRKLMDGLGADPGTWLRSGFDQSAASLLAAYHADLRAVWVYIEEAADERAECLELLREMDRFPCRNSPNPHDLNYRPGAIKGCGVCAPCRIRAILVDQEKP